MIAVGEITILGRGGRETGGLLGTAADRGVPRNPSGLSVIRRIAEIDVAAHFGRRQIRQQSSLAAIAGFYKVTHATQMIGHN